MSLDRCIKATAGELQLPEQDVREIARKLEKHRKRLVAEGRLDTLDADLRRFGSSAAEQARIEAIKKRQHAALNVVIRAEWERDLGELKGDGLSARDAIVAKLVGVVAGARKGRVSASARRVALEAKWLLGVEGDLAREAPLLMRQLKDAAGIPGTLRAALSGKLNLDPELQRNLDDIVREMAELREGGTPGRTGNEEARKAAQILRTRAEEARVAANKAGANIGRLDGWAGPQNHDADRLRKAGEETWLQAIRPLIDAERSFPGLGPDEVDEVLRNVFHNVVTGRDRRLTARQKGERTGPANLARSMEKHRVLHFRGADAWLAYARQFGSGNIVGDMLDHLHRMARTVANMQAMGPNPQVFLDAILEDERAAARAASPGNPEAAIKNLQELKADLDSATGLIGRTFAEVMGDTFGVHHLTGAKISSGVRAFTSMAKLGGALISSVTDLVTYAAAARFQGRGLLAGYADAVGRLFEGRTTEEQAQLARALGVFADGARDDILARFDAAENLPGRTTAAMSAFFRLSGLTWWTNRLKSGFARMMGASVGEDAGKAWDALAEPFRHVLGLHGIDGERWDVLRQAVSEQADGRRYILPDDVARLGDEAFIPLADAAIADVKLGISDWWARLRQANRRDAEWVAKRVERFHEKFQLARERLDQRRQRIAEQADAQAARIGERIGLIEGKLSEIAEAARALRGDERAIGRGEGRAKERIKALARQLQELDRDAGSASQALGAAFEGMWRARQDELGAFMQRWEDNPRAADWVEKRIERFREKFGRARDQLEQRRAVIGEDAATQAQAMRDRITSIEEHLSALAEAADAQRGPQRQMGRDEGRLSRRVQEMQGKIKEAAAAAQKQSKALGDEFEALWARRQDELVAFAEAAGERQAKRDEILASLPEVERRRVAHVIERERYELEMRLRELYSDETSFAVIEPDDRVRSMLVHGTQRGTIAGEVWRFITQFKAFPVAYTYKVLGRARYGAKGIRPDYGALPNIIAGSLVLGYVAMTAKDFLKNRTPKDPTKPETWLAAMLQGGGLGLYGDYIFGQYDRFGGGVGSSLLPPSASLPLSLVDLWQKAKSGDAKAGDAFYPLLNATPFLNLWWARSALDLAILNQVQEWISPGSLRRREQKIQKQFGQSYVVDPTPFSEASP